MVNVFRRFQQPLLVVLTIFVIVAFVILYGGPGTRLDRLGSDRIATLYNRGIQAPEYQKIARQFEICRSMGMLDLVIPLVQNARSMQDAVDNYVWNTLILRHQARELGIVPTDAQVVEAIQHLPAFQNNGKYDHSRYEAAQLRLLSPRGMSPENFEELIRDSIRLQTVRDILASSSITAPDEIRDAYQQEYQKTEAAVVRIARADIEKTVQISEQDISQAFEARKDGLKTAEKRKVEFVHFPLPKVEKDAPRPSAEELQKLADKSADFAAALLEPNAKFAEVAKRFEVEIKTTGLFAQSDKVAELSNQTRVNAAAFQLTTEKPFSDTIGTPQGYFVLHLVAMEAARPLSLAEAKPQLEESLRTERTRETLSLKAADARKTIEENLKNGKSFAQAAQAAGLKVETPAAFSRSDAKVEGADAELIRSTALDLKEGQTSTPREGAESTLLVHVLKRIDADPADIEKKKGELLPMLETRRTDGLLEEWVEQQRARAGLKLAGTP